MISAAALLSAGPTVLRMIGKLFGGKTEGVADQVAAFADQVKGLPADKAQQEFNQRLAYLPPEAQVELKKIALESERIQAEQEQARLQADTDQHLGSQETIRAEIIHGDEYVAHTRPKIARLSAYLGLSYLFIAEVASRVAEPFDIVIAGADPAVAGVLLGPCVYYMTMRTFDAFSKKGKT